MSSREVLYVGGLRAPRPDLIRDLGFVPLYPDAAILPGPLGMRYAEYLAERLVLLEHADAVYLPSDWETCATAQAEHAHAEAAGVVVLVGMEALLEVVR